MVNLTVKEGKEVDKAGPILKKAEIGTRVRNLEQSHQFGSGAGYTVALVQAAFGSPASLPDTFLGVYVNTANSKVYLVRVSAGAFTGSELTFAAVPAS